MFFIRAFSEIVSTGPIIIREVQQQLTEWQQSKQNDCKCALVECNDYYSRKNKQMQKWWMEINFYFRLLFWIFDQDKLYIKNVKPLFSVIFVIFIYFVRHTPFFLT